MESEEKSNVELKAFALQLKLFSRGRAELRGRQRGERGEIQAMGRTRAATRPPRAMATLTPTTSAAKEELKEKDKGVIKAA